MISDLMSYPAYKPSGVPGLGDVPGHWEVRRLTSCLVSLESGAREQSEAGSADGIPSLGGEHIGADGQLLLKNMRYVSLSFFESLRKGKIRRHDVLLVKDGATIGKVALISTIPYPRCAVNEHVFIMRPSDCCLPEFLYQNIRSSGMQESIWQEVTGSAQPGLNSSFIKSLSLCVPPLPEQAAIVRFLDHVDRRIRRYIRAKQKLIKLLEDQKQAVIHQAVTRGLDPNVHLKPSSVEWLGDVPEHWDIRRNGRLFTQRNQTGFADLPILEVSLKTGVRIRDFENSNRKQVMSDRDKYKLAIKGDIAYNMMRMWQGAVGVAPVDGLVSPAYVVARPLDGTETRYFSYLFRTAAYMSEVDKYSRGIVKDRNRLYWEGFKQILSPYPPPDEQMTIADAVDQSTRTVNDAIGRAQREVELIREYRTRLIADVVTGKLDVREAAVRMSDETEEREPLEVAEALTEGDEALEAVNLENANMEVNDEN